MEDYSVLEAAIKTMITTCFSTEFEGDATRCVAGDITSLLQTMSEKNAIYGCLLEFAGGRINRANPFDKDVWSWVIAGVMLIRYIDDVTVENSLRLVLDKLPHIFDDDHRLGGLTPLVRITQISLPETIQLVDIPFYWLPFEITVYSR